MFRFDNILEQWAIHYKPLSHDPAADAKRRAFYRIDTINSNNEFVQSHNIAHSPCMAYSTLIDASLARGNNKLISYRHAIYFLVKQPAPKNNAKTTINDAMEATEAKFDADNLVQDLLAFLYALKDEVRRNTPSSIVTNDSTIVERLAAEMSTDERKAFAGLKLDDAEWGTMPVRYNQWWICGLEIEQLVPRNLCVIEERYK